LPRRELDLCAELDEIQLAWRVLCREGILATPLLLAGGG
jgi:hypothetical protein